VSISVSGLPVPDQSSAQPTNSPSSGVRGEQGPHTPAAAASSLPAMKADSAEYGTSGNSNDYGTAIARVVNPESPLTATVKQSDQAGHPTTADLSQVRATKIEVKFRTAIPQVPNAQHAYIEITRANGAKQDLAAYPAGGFPQTHEGGQLQFSAGQEKAYANTPGPAFELHPPEGSSLTQYANSLVDGAKSYNAHAVRYDGLGQQSDRFNSNSFVSSLIVAKGGKTGLSDVNHIAKELDAGPVAVSGQAPALDDRAMAERVRSDAENKRLIATGFGNARIEPARFGNSTLTAATPPPVLSSTHDVSSAFGQAVGGLWDHVFGHPQPTSTPTH
jgi:hypothetical protein